MKSRRGSGLVEVMLALGLVSAGLFPAYTLLSEAREEARDSEYFLQLLERADERATSEANGTLQPRDILVENGRRALVLRVQEVDAAASFAPIVNKPAQEGGAE